MKKLFDRKILRVQGKKRPSTLEYQSQLGRIQNLSKWLLFIPIVMLVLFACGQLGILASLKLAERDALSDMQADYGPWTYVLIHSIKPEILLDMLQDKENAGKEDDSITLINESGDSWLNPTSLPTSGVTIEGSSVFTPTLSVEAPLPTASPISSFTATPTSTPQPTVTIVDTSIPGIPNTYWFANIRERNGYALVPNRPNGKPIEENQSLVLYTEPIPNGTTINEGQCVIAFYASNTSGDDQRIAIELSVGISSESSLGGTSLFIPAKTATPTFFSVSFSIPSHTFTNPNPLTLSFILPSQVKVYWDGEWNNASMMLP